MSAGISEHGEGFGVHYTWHFVWQLVLFLTLFSSRGSKAEALSHLWSGVRVNCVYMSWPVVTACNNDWNKQGQIIAVIKFLNSKGKEW